MINKIAIKNTSAELFGSFEIRINNNKDKKFLYGFIYPYKHWQNILTILVTGLFKQNIHDYKYFLDYEIVRACISATKGSKNKIETIKYIKDKYQDNNLYQSLMKVGRELKNHNLVMIVRRYKKDVSNYFIELKDYKINPNKYTGRPQLPKPRKLAKLTHYSIPLDNANGVRFKKNRIGINLKDKVRYFYIGKIINNAKVLDKKIQSVAIVMKNQEIYLSFGYTANEAEYKTTFNKIIGNNENYPINATVAGIDIGLNNLISLFIDDKKTQSLIFSGNKYKYYNAKFNRFIAKLNNSVSAKVIAYKTITKKDEITVQIAIKWTKRGHRLKRYISFLYRKRNDFFKTEFHKIAKRTVEYLHLNKVKELVLSKSLADLMNNGKCKLRKKTKQNFIQIPFIELLNYIEDKAIKNGIKVIFINEAYTSKTSCINGDVKAVQTQAKNGQKPRANAFKGTRAKRGLFKDIVLSKIWNADLNGAVNHLKIAFSGCFLWLKNSLFKLCNPIKLKSVSDFLRFNLEYRNSKAGKVQLSSAGQTIL